MTYSCTDFTDSILDALDIDLDGDEMDDPSAQADYALEEIERLQRIEKAVTYALHKYDDKSYDCLAFAERVKEIMRQNQK